MGDDSGFIANVLLICVVIVTRMQQYCVTIVLPLVADKDHSASEAKQGVHSYQIGLIISS